MWSQPTTIPGKSWSLLPARPAFINATYDFPLPRQENQLANVTNNQPCAILIYVFFHTTVHMMPRVLDIPRFCLAIGVDVMANVRRGHEVNRA